MNIDAEGQLVFPYFPDSKTLLFPDDPLAEHVDLLPEHNTSTENDDAYTRVPATTHLPSA